MTTRNQYRRIDQRAWELRQSGASFADIASAIGYTEATARACVRRHEVRLGLAPTPTGRTTASRRQQGRTYGLEFEFKTAIKRSVAEGIAAAVGGACNAPGYTPHVPVVGYHGKKCRICGLNWRKTQWKVEHDGSVSMSDNPNSPAGEVVSPILRGENGLEQVQKVLAVLREKGATVDVACGVHVHLGVQTMTNEGRANVIRAYQAHNDTIDRFVSESRRKEACNRYCRRPSDHEWTSWAQHFANGGHGLYADRYRSLNVTSYPKYGTFEVRQHQGTLNFRKIKAWVSFLIALFDTAEANEHGALAPGLALLGSLADTGRLSQDLASYMTARAVRLARS